jgi:hypothetical protein
VLKAHGIVLPRLKKPKRLGYIITNTLIIARIDGLIVVIYPHDHAPPHVHMLGPDGEIIYELNCPTGPVSIREVRGYSEREARKLAKRVNELVPFLCSAWKGIHA